MRILCTHAGRHGDALWALATVRAIAETVGEPVDFVLPAKYGGIAQLVQEQDYIGRCFVDQGWEVRETAPITPAMPPGFAEAGLERVVEPLEPQAAAGYDKVVHLSFRGWPMSRTLAEGYWENVYVEHFGPAREGGARPNSRFLPELRPLELERPWIAADPLTQVGRPGGIVIGFSDEWFELKVGLVALLEQRRDWDLYVACAPGSRWEQELGFGGMGWSLLAAGIAKAGLFVGCLSAPWVLANALGQRCVVVEPSEPRHHPVFWLDSPRNALVRGGDGRPTFDGRAVLKEVERALAGAEQGR